MVVGLGLLEEPEPVGGHVDGRGIRVCGQDSPGLDLQTASGSRFRGCAVCRLTGRRFGSLAGRQFLRGVGECRCRRKRPLILPARCRGVIGLPIRCAALIGCGVRPETGRLIRSFGSRRLPAAGSVSGAGWRSDDSFPACMGASAVRSETPAVFGAFPAAFAV